MEGVHYVRPFGGRKILFVWETIERDMKVASTLLPVGMNAIPMANGAVLQRYVTVRNETGKLVMDFTYRNVRCRERATLPDTLQNRKRVEVVLEKDQEGAERRHLPVPRLLS